MAYLFAEKWRGSITISSVRVFEGEALMEQFLKDFKPTVGKRYCFVWKVSQSAEPELLSKDRLKELGLR